MKPATVHAWAVLYKGKIVSAFTDKEAAYHQCTDKENEVRSTEYPSMTKASQAIGLSVSAIWVAINLQSKADGSNWKYAK